MNRSQPMFRLSSNKYIENICKAQSQFMIVVNPFIKECFTTLITFLHHPRKVLSEQVKMSKWKVTERYTSKAPLNNKPSCLWTCSFISIQTSHVQGVISLWKYLTAKYSDSTVRKKC